MSNATSNLIKRPYGGQPGRLVNLPVDGGSHIYDGTLVAQLGTGMVVPGSTASSGAAIGVAQHEQDNSSGSDGDKRVLVEYGRIYELANAAGGDACSEALPMYAVVYMTDDHTVADNDASGTLKPAGRFMGMSEDGKVRVFVGMANLGDAFATAADISIADAGTFTAQVDVEEALQEIYQHILSAQRSICFSLHELREVDANGDVGDTTANGGLLSSNTTPILRADAAESEEVSWATGNVDAVQLQRSLPADFDGSANVLVELDVYSGTTNAATFTVETSWDGGAKVSDAATDASPSATPKTVTATVAAADVPNAARRVTITLIPAAHATDTIQLLGVRVLYKGKLLTS